MDLNEATRRLLIDKSKNADIVKAYGTTRYDRRNLLHISKSVNSFNKIDFNALFRANLLSFKIPIKGETDTYEIEFLFENVCDDIKREIKANNNLLDYKCVYRALIDSINKQDIMVSCTCPDWKYRQAYDATKLGYNSGPSELRPAKITNPNDTAGAGCKHVMAALGNLDWALRLATSVYNYIRYMEEHDEPRFSLVIFPAIFDISYEDYSSKNSLFVIGDQELANSMTNPEDTEVVDQANNEGEQAPEEEERSDEDREEPEEEGDENGEQ